MNFLRRVPIFPTLISVAVVLTSAFAVSPIFDSATRGDVVDAFMERSLGYVVIAPLSDVLDTLTLLSDKQHLAVLLGAVVVFAMWRALKRNVGIRAHVTASAVFVGGIVLVYVAAALLPRPIAALRSNNDSVIKVDFHSHTSASHDGHQSV
jgi:hypothetical protein